MKTKYDDWSDKWGEIIKSYKYYRSAHDKNNIQAPFISLPHPIICYDNCSVYFSDEDIEEEIQLLI